MLQQQGPVGGSNGATVTVANSAATGDGFAAVTSTSATFIYDNSVTFYGYQSYKLATGATSVVCNATWTYTGVATVQERIYFAATDWTSTQNAGLRIRAVTTQACRVTFDSTGHAVIHNTTNGVVATSTTALTAGVKYRLEVTCTQGASGTVSYSIYDLATETLQDSMTAVTGNYGTANLTESGFGFFTATANINPWWFANLATTDAGFPIGVGGAFVSLTDAETLTDALGIATGSTPVTLGDAQTLTDVLAVVMSLPKALADTSTLTSSLAVAVSTPSVGVPFRQDIYGVSAYLAVEAAWGADLTQPAATWTWYDITPDVMYNPGITVNPGRGDETSQSTTTSCPLALLNLSGNYSDFVTTGIYGAGVRKGTPLRVRLNLGAGFVVAFQGRIWDLTPTWDTTGKLPIVRVQASGRLRQLGQPKASPLPPMQRAIGQMSGVLAHWPMQDGQGAKQCLPAVGRKAMTILSGAPALGSDGGAGATGAVDFTAGGVMVAPIPLAVSPTSWRVTMGINYTGPITPPGLSTDVVNLICTNGDAWGLQLVTNTNAEVFLTYTQASGVSQTVQFNGPASVSLSGWRLLEMTAVQNGATIDVGINFGAHGWVTTTGFLTGTLAALRNAYLSADQPGFGASNSAISINNFAVSAPTVVSPSTTTPDLALAVTGFVGETPDARIARVAAEEGIACLITGSSNVTLGVQPTDSPLAIFRDAEKADMGVLYDGFSDGMGYVCRSARYNQSAAITVDAGSSGGQLAPPFQPANDDQRLTNSFTASGAGSSVTVSDTSSPLSIGNVGGYSQSDSYNTADSTYLSGIAGMRVNQGTVNLLRYPSIGLNFLNPQQVALAPTWLALAASATPISFRMDVRNISSSALNHPPGTFSLVVEGYTLRLTNLEWSVAMNCSSFLPYRGWTIKSSTQGRIQPSATTLNTVMSTVSTGTINILTPYKWSTLAADYPSSIQIDGEQITVTGAGTWSAGAQTLTVSARSQNGVISTHLVGAAITLFRPGKVLL